MRGTRGSAARPNLAAALDTLQTAYDRGNTISVDGNPGPILLENATDGVDVLQIDRSFAGGGDGLQVNMGATTTGDGVTVNMVAGAAGRGLIVKQGATVYFSVGPTGALSVTPASGQNIAMTAAGTGTINVVGGDAVSILGGAVQGGLDIATNGNTAVRSGAGRTLSLHSNGAGTAQLIVNSVGRVIVQPTATRPFEVTTSGASAGIIFTATGDFTWDDQYTRSVVGSVQTTDATVTTLLSIATASDKTYNVRAMVTANRTVAGAGGNEGAAYCIIGGFKNDNGTLSQIGATAALATIEDVAGWACVFDVSGTDIRVRVTGEAAKTIDWRVRVEVVRAS